MTVTRTAKLKRTAAAILAVFGWALLALQLWLAMLTAGMTAIPPMEGTLRFFSSFGIQAHVLATLVLTAFAIKSGPDEWLVHPFVRSAVAVYVTMAGLIHVLLARPLWSPVGALWIAGAVLQCVMPVAYLLFWLACVRKAGLRWYDPLLWLIYPLFYLCFVLVRGKMSGFYPYPFIDAKTLGYAAVAANTAGLLVVCAAIGFCLVMVGWWLSRRQPV
jgi:hypothetical protein